MFLDESDTKASLGNAEFHFPFPESESESEGLFLAPEGKLLFISNGNLRTASHFLIAVYITITPLSASDNVRIHVCA